MDERFKKPRFQVIFFDDAKAQGLPLPWTGPYHDRPFCWILYDFATDPPTMINTDEMEPEDVSFVRDLAWVPKLLNELAGWPVQEDKDETS